MKMVIYDIEIKKAIANKHEARLQGVEYCDGWHDHENMGISVIGVYDYDQDRYRVFCEDNFAEFQKLIESTDVVAGFNSIAFDNAVCRAHGIEVPDDKSYDLLVELWLSHNLAPKFHYPTHIGFSLDAVASININHQKTGHGAYAPVQWQRGEVGNVVDYCLADVWLTKQLIDKVIADGKLISPRDRDVTVDITPPFNIELPTAA